MLPPLHDSVPASVHSFFYLDPDPDPDAMTEVPCQAPPALDTPPKQHPGTWAVLHTILTTPRHSYCTAQLLAPANASWQPSTAREACVQRRCRTRHLSPFLRRLLVSGLGLDLSEGQMVPSYPRSCPALLEKTPTLLNNLLPRRAAYIHW